MSERHDGDDRQAATVPQTRPLPADFDDLLDRLAQTAQDRRARRGDRTGTED